jgi:hypothetical protein
MEIVGSSGEGVTAGEEPTGGLSSDFHGNDPSKWVTGARQFAKVRVSGMRPGLDLLYYANQNQLEYDLVLKPGARPEDVRLRFAGAQRVSLNGDGVLRIETAAGELIQHRPQVWQGDRHKAVPARYRVSKNGEVSVVVGKYDRSRELVIDPVISYSTYLSGGSGTQAAAAIVVDGSGNAYVTGQTGLTNFPTTVGAYSVAENGSIDVFVAKLNPTGTALIYSTYLGGSNDDIGTAIAIDSSGNAYVTGGTSSTNFPVTAGVYQSTKQSGSPHSDVFVTKLNSSGTALVYSTYLGATVGTQTGNGIKVDSGGNAYVTGTTSSTNFPTVAGSYAIATGGSQAVFVTKINPVGTQLVYSTYFGGIGSDTAYGIALDSSNNAYIAGGTTSFNFPTTAGAFQTTSIPGFEESGFVSEISSDGTSLAASTYLGGAYWTDNQDTSALALALDSSNNVYVTGYTEASSFPTTPGAFMTAQPGQKDYNRHAFVTKLPPSLGSLVYSSYLGGSVVEGGFAIAVDSNGNAYVAGGTGSPDFPITTGSLFGKTGYVLDSCKHNG